MFGQSGQATIGLYIGQGLLNQGLSTSAMKLFEDNLDKLNISTPSLAMQLCGPEYDSDHTERQLSKVSERTFGQGNSNTTSRRRAALKSSPAQTANKAASMALQTRIWERE
ncbi:hypothetical protein EJ02DRAFT_450548, partial [Clathrospora elynae]